MEAKFSPAFVHFVQAWEIQDVNRVALEAGNSPQMIFRYYRELATPEQARTWFSIAPDASDKVIAISAGRKR